MVNDRIPTKITKISERQFEMIIESGKFTQEELDVLKWYSGKIETYLKNMSGSKWRNESTMSEKDKIQVTDILHYLKLINDKVKFTNFDIEKASNHYEKTGKFNSDIKEIIRDYQFLTSKQIELLGQPLLRNTDKSELEKLDGILKIGKYNGGRLKVETEGEIGRINKNDAKFELNINNGKGSLTIYEKVNVREENGKIGKSKDYVKTRVINFDLNKKTYNTEIWHIHGDGIWGTDTSNGLNFIMEKLTKVEKPVTISLGFSTNGYYQRKIEGKYDYNQSLEYMGIQINTDLNEPMKDVPYEKQREIFYEDNKIYTQQQQMIHDLYFKNGREVNQSKFDEMSNDFSNKRGKEKSTEVDFILLNKEDMNKKNFDINFESIEKDFDYAKKVIKNSIGIEYQKIHLGLIDKYEMEIKNIILDIKEKSKNVEDFLNNLNNNKVVETYTAFLKCYLHMPDEVNLFEQIDARPDKNNPTTRALENLSKENPKMEQEIQNEYITERRYGHKLLNLKKMKESDEELYYNFMYYLIPEQIKEQEKSFNPPIKQPTTIDNSNKSIPKTEINKPEPKKESKIEQPVKIVASKSPSLEETENFIELMRKNPALAKTYQKFYNNWMKIEGKKYRLKVDGDVGDKTIATSKELPFDEFWALYNNQSTYERRILPKIKMFIEKDSVEMKKYNAYVQKMDKEMGGRPTEDKWIYLTSYINKSEQVKKEQKQEISPEKTNKKIPRY